MVPTMKGHVSEEYKCTMRTNLQTAFQIFQHIQVFFRCVCRQLSLASLWGYRRCRITSACWNRMGLPSGYVKIAIENAPFIVSFSIKMVIFHSYVSLPEGTCSLNQISCDHCVLLTASSGCLTLPDNSWIPAARSAMPVVPKKRSSAVGTTEAAGERLVFMGLFMLFVCSKTYVYII